MRAAAIAVCLFPMLAGCLSEPGIRTTPCEPEGAATYGTLRVQLRTLATDFDPPMATPGQCVALSQDDKVLSTARIGPDGNATLNLPVAGEVFIAWSHTRPQDHYCSFTASAIVTVPGPANVTLDHHGLCT